MAPKKKTVHAAERASARVVGLRGAFLEAIQAIDFNRFHFVDETSTNLTYARRYGRAPGGQRAPQGVPLHKAAGLAEIVEKCGARFLFLPPYSPDFNPIELAYSKLKTWLRTAAARTRQALDDALTHALTWISETDAHNWFDHCGYHIH